MNSKKWHTRQKKYLEILEENENHPDANHNFSVLLIEQNRIDEARKYIENNRN